MRYPDKQAAREAVWEWLDREALPAFPLSPHDCMRNIRRSKAATRKEDAKNTDQAPWGAFGRSESLTSLRRLRVLCAAKEKSLDMVTDPKAIAAAVAARLPWANELFERIRAATKDTAGVTRPAWSKAEIAEVPVLAELRCGG